MITLVISWRPFLILRLKKIIQRLETHIHQYIITRMLQMHNQSRKNYISQNKVTPKLHIWLPN